MADADLTASTVAPGTIAPGLIPSPPPVTEDAFVMDRQMFWSWFTGLLTKAAVSVAVVLILLAIFLA